MNAVLTIFPRSSWTPRLIATVFCLIAIAAVWLRWHYASEPLWVDELHTAWSTDCPLYDVAGRAAQGNQAPLYFWIIWTFKSVFADSALVIRMTSVVFGLLALILASGFVWQSSGNLTATIVTAWIIAIDAQFVFYSTEARPYVLVQLLAIMQIMVLCREFGNGRVDQSAGRVGVNWKITLLTAALLLTHVTAVWIVIAEALLVSLFWNRTGVQRVLVSLAAGLLGLIPSLSILTSAFEKRNDWLVVSNIAQYVRESSIQIAILIVLPVTLVIAGRAIFDRSDRDASGASPGVLYLLAGCAVLPIFFCFVLQSSGIAPVAAYRYSLVGSVAVPIFCGLVIGKIRPRVLRQIGAGVVLILIVYFNPMIGPMARSGQLPRFRNENWQKAIDVIESRGKSDQPVFLFANLVEDHRAVTSDDPEFLRYLSFPLTGQFKLSRTRKIIPMPTIVETHWQDSDLSAIRDGGGGWIVFRSTSQTADSIADELEQFALGQGIEISFSVELYESGNNVLVMKINSAQSQTH